MVENELTAAGGAAMTTEWTTEAKGAGAYADVNGISLYYEIHGTGMPLVLLHGGLGASEMFGPALGRLAEAHQVIAVDLQGHGRTADVDRPIRLETMAEDIAALLNHLGIERVDAVGYSLGGGVAFQLAVRHPDRVRRLVVVSAYFRDDAVDPALRAQQDQVNAAAAEFMKDTPMYALYTRLAPRPQDFPRLLDKIGEYMRQPFDMTAQLRAIRVPTMLVTADADMAPPSHSVEAFKLLDGGLRDGGWMGENRPKGGHALAVLPGLQHYNIFSSPLTAETILAFLDAPDVPIQEGASA
jgi:pimeloyl-ACP methyl ester carboxylesterase